MSPEQIEALRRLQSDLMGGQSHEQMCQAMQARMAINGFWFHPDDREKS